MFFFLDLFRPFGQDLLGSKEESSSSGSYSLGLSFLSFSFSSAQAIATSAHTSSFFFWSRFAWFGEYLPVLHACQSHIHLKLTTIALNHTPNDTFTRF